MTPTTRAATVVPLRMTPEAHVVSPRCLVRRVVRDDIATSLTGSLNLIEAGQITVDGIVVDDPAYIVAETSVVWVAR